MKKIFIVIISLFLIILGLNWFIVYKHTLRVGDCLFPTQLETEYAEAHKFIKIQIVEKIDNTYTLCLNTIFIPEKLKCEVISKYEIEDYFKKGIIKKIECPSF